MTDFDYSNEWMRSRLYVPLTAGGLAAVATYTIVGGSGNQIYGVHPSVAFGVSVAVASNVSDMTKDYVIDKLNESEEASALQMAIIGPSLTGLAAVGVSTLAIRTPTMKGAMVLFAIGAGSEIAAQYVSNQIIAPEVERM